MGTASYSLLKCSNFLLFLFPFKKTHHFLGRWIKLMCKHEHLSSVPQNTCRRWNETEHICNVSIGTVEAAGSLEHIGLCESVGPALVRSDVSKIMR